MPWPTRVLRQFAKVLTNFSTPCLRLFPNSCSLPKESADFLVLFEVLLEDKLVHPGIETTSGPSLRFHADDHIRSRIGSKPCRFKLRSFRHLQMIWHQTTVPCYIDRGCHRMMKLIDRIFIYGHPVDHSRISKFGKPYKMNKTIALLSFAPLSSP